MVYLKPSELNNPANYNAVRIQVNDPKTRIPEDYKTNPDNDGVYNGVDIQVNRPSVETYTKPIYQYPEANGIITYDMAAAALKPRLSYQTNLINNRTYIHNNNSYDLEFEIEQPEKQAVADEVNIGADNDANNEILDEQEAEIIPAVPEPNYTTTEAEKGEGLNFHGVNFQAKKEPEIIPSEDILPEVDITKVVENLNSLDYDIQAKQMEEIARVSMEDSEKAIPYIVRDVFSSLINIVKKDTINLTPPSQEQNETRRKIIVNELIKEYAANNKLDSAKMELPYQLTEEDVKKAGELTNLEQAERNKEYALYAMAILAKVYTENVEKQTGTVVPMTDLPGISAVVDTLRYNDNPGIKIAAIDALLYINRPEYKEEIASLLTLTSKDKNNFVASTAAEALSFLNNSDNK